MSKMSTTGADEEWHTVQPKKNKGVRPKDNAALAGEALQTLRDMLQSGALDKYQSGSDVAVINSAAMHEAETVLGHFSTADRLLQSMPQIVTKLKLLEKKANVCKVLRLPVIEMATRFSVRRSGLRQTQR